MARETKAARLAREEAEALVAHEKHLDFVKTLPKVLKELFDRTQKLGTFNTRIELLDDGVQLIFWHQDTNTNHSLTSTEATQEWEVEEFKGFLNRLELLQRETAARIELAKNVWSNLSEAEQTALVEVKPWMSWKSR